GDVQGGGFAFDGHVGRQGNDRGMMPWGADGLAPRAGAGRAQCPARGAAGRIPAMAGGFPDPGVGRGDGKMTRSRIPPNFPGATPALCPPARGRAITGGLPLDNGRRYLWRAASTKSSWSATSATTRT